MDVILLYIVFSFCCSFACPSPGISVMKAAFQERFVKSFFLHELFIKVPLPT